MKKARAVVSICALVLTALIAACASERPKEQAQKAPPAPAAVPAPAPRPVVQPPLSENPLHDPTNILAKRSVYYAYDKYEVTADYQPLVEAHAKYLREHPGASIVIQGNTDERGSREYNLALGQRRAEGVMKMMTLLGVSGGQIEALSFGEEKPKAAGHDEAAWAQNRRSDIEYVREK